MELNTVDKARMFKAITEMQSGNKFLEDFKGRADF